MVSQLDKLFFSKARARNSGSTLASHRWVTDFMPTLLHVSHVGDNVG